MATVEDNRIEKLRLEREIEQLNDRLRAEQGEVVTPPSDGLCLIIKGEAFECRRVGTSWQMMQFSKAQQAANVRVPDPIEGHVKEDNGKKVDECDCGACKKRRALEEKRNNAGMAMLATLHDTAMVLLKPSERDRFRDFMNDASMSDEGIEPGELESAIGEVIAAAGGEEGKAGTRTSRRSSTSSTSTNASAPADLSDKATAEIVGHGTT